MSDYKYYRSRGYNPVLAFIAGGPLLPILIVLILVVLLVGDFAGYF